MATASGRKRTSSGKRRLPQTLSREEVAAVLGAFNLDCPTGLRDRCMFELMYRAGLRVSEVCQLDPRDVDVHGGRVRIDEGKTGDGWAYFDSGSLELLLGRWRQERRRIGPAKGAPLFTTLAGGPIGPRHLQKKIKRMAKRAGVDPEKVTPHRFRHTFATELLDEGFNIRKVQAALRHADIRTTQIYTHVLDAELRDEIQRRKRA